VLPLSIITIRAELERMLSLFRALTGTVTSYRTAIFPSACTGRRTMN
jgi:hypothetical protein